MSEYKYHMCKADPNVQSSWAVYDYQGIYLFRACDKCEEAKRAQYNPWVFTGYDQSDVDEDIEPDDYVGWEDY